MTLAQDLAEKCQKKLQIAFFSAVDDRMWWECLFLFTIKYG